MWDKNKLKLLYTPYVARSSDGRRNRRG